MHLISWDNFDFLFTWKVSFRFAGMNMLRGIAVSLLWFGFSLAIYNSAIITLNSFLAYQLQNLIP